MGLIYLTVPFGVDSCVVLGGRARVACASGASRQLPLNTMLHENSYRKDTMSNLAIKSAQVHLHTTLNMFRVAVRSLSQKDPLQDAPELIAFNAELTALWQEISRPTPSGSKLEEIWGVVQHFWDVYVITRKIHCENQEYENLDWSAEGVDSAISLYRSCCDAAAVKVPEGY